MHSCIRIRGHLDPGFQDQFGGLHVEHQEVGTTQFSGFLPDQAVLHGVLLQLIRLSLVQLSAADGRACTHQ